MDFWNDVMGSDWGIQGTKSSQHIKAKKKKRTCKIKLENEELNDGMRILHRKCGF